MVTDDADPGKKNVLGQDDVMPGVADTLVSFALKHNLLIGEHDRHSLVWRLCFAHPEGGSAIIKVVKKKPSDDSILVEGIWWLDHYDSFTQYLRHTKPKETDLDKTRINNTLEELFSEMLSWNSGSWSEVKSGNRENWGVLTRNEFAERTPKFPKPKA